MAESGGSLISFGDLSKPATVLMEKISEAIGGVFKPFQIKRIAKAEAEASLIAAAGDIAVNEFRQRAAQRLIHEGERQQHNIEDITRLALPELSPHSEPDQLDSDWISHFFERAKLVSDPEMQTLWARVLAGEANAPGSFSRRTVDFVATLEKSEARSFTTLCSLSWIIDRGEPIPLVFGTELELYRALKLDFGVLTHLDSIGLIRFDGVTPFLLERLPATIEASYFGRGLTLELPQSALSRLTVGHVILTKMGQQLVRLSGAGPNDEFFTFACETFRRYCNVTVAHS